MNNTDKTSEKVLSEPLHKAGVIGSRFKPILFSTPMVQAILEGRKTQTRRICKVNIQPSKMYENDWNFESKNHAAFNISLEELNTEFLGVLGLSKYKIGDILWVRETYGLYYFGSSRYWHIKNGIKWEEKDICYKADDHDKTKFGEDDAYFLEGKKWKPSIFMPKDACRIFLKVTDVRVDRLQNISEGDAISEGVEKIGTLHYTNYLALKKECEKSMWEITMESAKESFQTLWKKINGKESWEENPFVWVYTFERIKRPQDFR